MLKSQHSGSISTVSYNLGNTEFLIGAYESRPHTLSQIDSMWAYFDSLGVDVPYLGGLSNEEIDTLADSSDQWWHTGRRFMAHGLAPFVKAGYGRQVQFFTFDSVESSYWKCLFTNLVGGSIDTNHTEDDKPNGNVPTKFIVTRTIPLAIQQTNC